MAIIIGNYLTNTFFMLVILLMLWVRASYLTRQPLSRRRCQGLIVMTACYVATDAAFIACDLWEECPHRVFAAVVFVFYVVYVLLPYFWHLFVRNFVGSSFKPITLKLEIIPAAVLLILVAMTPFTGVLWSIRADCTYVRGPLFGIFTYLNFFYYCEPFIYAIVIHARKHREKEPYLPQALLISLVPLLAAAVNNLVIPIYSIFPFQPFCSVLVALLGYFFMAARESDISNAQHQQAIQEALNQAQFATQQAVEASKVKSTFLSNMSHDIRTPMNAVINLTGLALKEEDPAVVKEYLNKIQISGKFLLGLINDILDMSRIESGELTLNKERLTRTEFLNTVETVVRPLMDARHLHFHSELRPGEYTILVDKLRFNQIFFNLLSNAAKFTPEGGDVWFEVSNIETENGKLHIRFVVRDNGIGMSEAFLEHLFEPFAREQSELSNARQGTGLGLPIVKNLVDAMGGTISVKSELGKGTEFVVEIYADIAERKGAPVKPLVTADTPKLDGMRVLLVEDNEVNIYVAQIILENAGCVVTTAKNGLEALNTFAASPEHAFDAILMDVRMPVMDGIEATKAIRALERSDAAGIPIIAMTADAFDEERKRTIESGMNYHLSKPVDANYLYAVLGECAKKQ